MTREFWVWQFEDGELHEQPFGSLAECEHDAIGYYGHPVQLVPITELEVAQKDAERYRWPEHLTRAVDQWFAQNTGLGGCADSDVEQLADIFYGLTYEGGRESVDDALDVVDSFGPGIEGLNDTYARQVLLAKEVRRLRAASATQEK